VRRILVVGLTGQVGAALQSRLAELGEVWALSRSPPVATAGFHWLTGSLQAMPPLPGGIDTILSLGPLDAFADWYEREGLPGVRIVALGSTGRTDKAGSGDPEEQAVAQALADAEARLFAAGQRRQARITLLRPTLIYGHGRDASLSWMLALARRFGVVLLPSGASGLRQPVHVDDVADAVLACLDAPATFDRSYDLPGGERLTFRAMVERSLARRAPKARVWVVPRSLFRAALVVAGVAGLRRPGRGFLERVARDQIAESGPARDAFGYRPRGFEP
jgi:nucleoside-diphosphate-sugar epimerase